MSLTSRLLGVRAAAPVDRAHGRAPKGGTSSVWWSSPGQPQIPEWDGLTAVRNGYQASIYVMQPVRIIATALGSLPFRVGADPDKRNDYDVDAPMARLLGPPPHGPNPVTSPRNLWIWSLVQRLITGRMAWETLSPAGQDAPAALWPLVTPFLQPIPSQPGSASWFDGFIYQLPSGRVDYKPGEVFYSWRPSQIDWRQPESALQAASMPTSLQVALDRYMWALAKNGLAAKKLVITPDFAEDDERRAWEEQFASEFTGYANGGRVLHGYYEDDPQASSTGNRTPPIQVVDLASSPADAQVLEILAAVKNDMLRTWRVPMSWMGDSSARTYENANQEAKNFWQGPVMELAAEICDDVNLTLASRFGDGNVGWFDFSGVEALKGTSIFGPIDPTAAKKAGLIVTEDWRNDVGLPPLAGDPPLTEAEALPAVDDTPGGSSKANFTRAAADKPTVIAAGLAVKALDTGRVLLLQRAMSDDDPASGTWEFPGGKLDPDEDPFAAAVREWQEEVGCALPQGRVAGTWTSPNGVYRGFVYLVAAEALVTCNLDHEDRHVLNPDDPDGDQIEVVAWWNPAQLPAMSALRPEARKGTDWHLLATAGNDEVRMASIGNRYDTAPLGLGDNWVTKGGGLDPFHRAIAHALMRSGHSESSAIQIALGSIKRWAAGEGHVTAKTRAKAARALARWEELRSQAHATPNKRGSYEVIDANRGDVAGHVFHGNQWAKLGQASHEVIDAADISHGEAIDAHRPDAVARGIRAVKKTGHVRLVGQGPHQQRVAGVMRSLLARERVQTGQHPVTVNGAGYLRVFDASRHGSTAPNRRDAVTESSSAGALLPVAPMPTVVTRTHMYVPSKTDRRKCGRAGCSLPVTAAVHGLTGKRHAGPGHVSVKTGHRTAVRRQTLTRVHGQADSLEPAMRTAMAGVFAAQRKATLDRLNGRRGSQMLRAAQPPTDPPVDGQPPEKAPLVDAAQVYDLAHWVAKTRAALEPTFAAIASLTTDRFGAQFGEHETKQSLAGVRQALDARLQRLADTVSRTTFDQVAQILRDGVTKGQTVAELTAALGKVFDDAEQNRAPMIARTESLGSLNEAAATYAAQAGTAVVAGQEWLAAHDDRVRPTHRAADGQVRAMGAPFLVGGVPMAFPHDPAAPPDETVNCRCSLAFLTPAEYAQQTRPASVAA